MSVTSSTKCSPGRSFTDRASCRNSAKSRRLRARAPPFLYTPSKRRPTDTAHHSPLHLVTLHFFSYLKVASLHSSTTFYPLPAQYLPLIYHAPQIVLSSSWHCMKLTESSCQGRFPPQFYRTVLCCLLFPSVPPHHVE